MSKKYQFQLPFDVEVDPYIKKNFPEIREYRTVSKSLDARGAPRGKKPIYLYIIDALVTPQDSYATAEAFQKFKPLEQKPIIIGAGPGGLFCAVRLAEHGVPSIIIERGDAASKRMLHMES